MLAVTGLLRRRWSVSQPLRPEAGHVEVKQNGFDLLLGGEGESFVA
jgi:hypothetical protein